MTKKRGLLFAGVATAGFLALGSGVLAADLPPEPVATWTGFHIGIGGGYGSVLHDGFAEVVAEVDDEDEDLYNLLDFNDLGDEAGLGTIEAGFDWQANENFVLGIFGDLPWPISRQRPVTSCARTTGATSSASASGST